MLRCILFTCLYAASTISAQSDVVPLRVSSGPKDESWWLWAEFEPVHKSIRGIPIGQIDPSWVKASELNLKSVPKSFINYPDEDPKKRDIVCSKADDYDHDGNIELAIVGIFKSRANIYGSFVAIFKKKDKSEWSLSYVHQLPGRSGFLMIPSKSKTLEIWPCLDCDTFYSIIWNQKRKSYEWQVHTDD